MDLKVALTDFPCQIELSKKMMKFINYIINFKLSSWIFKKDIMNLIKHLRAIVKYKIKIFDQGKTPSIGDRT